MAVQKKRLFVALQVPEDWRQAAAMIQRELERRAPGFARWVDPSSMHLTLVFLGYQPVSRLDELTSALRAAARRSSPFRLSWGPPGCFGSPGRVRVIWVGVQEATSRLHGLHRALVEELTRASVQFDNRSLAPHITLGRAKQEQNPASSRLMWEAVAGLAVPVRPASFRVHDFALMESHLSPSGAQYAVVQMFHLADDVGDA